MVSVLSLSFGLSLHINISLVSLSNVEMLLQAWQTDETFEVCLVLLCVLVSTSPKSSAQTALTGFTFLPSRPFWNARALDEEAILESS